MADQQLVCPKCLTDDGLRSIEKAQVAYPARFTAAGPDYTAKESTVYDEGTTFEDLIDCRNCDSMDMTLSDLVAAPEPEHQTYADGSCTDECIDTHPAHQVMRDDNGNVVSPS